MNLNTQAAMVFFQKHLAVCHSTTHRVIMIDKNPAYPFRLTVLVEGFIGQERSHNFAHLYSLHAHIPFPILGFALRRSLLFSLHEAYKHRLNVYI
jgi:hypothetical protein